MTKTPTHKTPKTEDRPPAAAPSPETSDLEGQMAERRRLVAELRAAGINPFANDARVRHQLHELLAAMAC